MRLISCHDGQLQELTPHALRAPARGGFATGMDELDRLAPGGQFARGAMHEILCESENGPGLFFAALLARSAMTANIAAKGISSDDGSKHNQPVGQFVCWCDSEATLYPPSLAAGGMDLSRLLLVRPLNGRDVLWAMAEALRCQGVVAVVGTVPRTLRLSRILARRLQLSAERGGTVGLLLRQAHSPGIDCYAAATRWLIRPAPGERTCQRWSIQLIHGHGGLIGQTVILEVSRENHSLRAFTPMANRSLEACPRSIASIIQAS